MIEFFVSKLWALVSALAVLGVVVTSINGAVHVAVDQSREDAFQNLVDSLGGMDEGSQGHMELALSEVLNEDEELRMGGGIIELIGLDHHFVRTLPGSVTLYGRDGAELPVRPVALSELRVDLIHRHRRRARGHYGEGLRSEDLHHSFHTINEPLGVHFVVVDVGRGPCTTI